MLGVTNNFVSSSLLQTGVRMRPPITPTIITELVQTRPSQPRIAFEKGKVIVRHQVRLTGDLACSLGWIVGDGYTNGREIDAIVSLREKDIIEPVVRPVLERFGRVFLVPRNGAILIRCNWTLLARVLCLPSGVRYWTDVDIALNSPTYARFFIAGFWDADGGIYRESNGTIRVHLYNSNLSLLDGVAESMELHYGTGASIYHRKTNEPVLGSRIHQQSDRFDLYVPARYNRLWKRYIASLMHLPWKKPITHL
jgi:hypothetical protein